MDKIDINFNAVVPSLKQSFTVHNGEGIARVMLEFRIADFPGALVLAQAGAKVLGVTIVELPTKAGTGPKVYI